MAREGRGGIQASAQTSRLGTGEAEKHEGQKRAAELGPERHGPQSHGQASAARRDPTGPGPAVQLLHGRACVTSHDPVNRHDPSWGLSRQRGAESPVPSTSSGAAHPVTPRFPRFYQTLDHFSQMTVFP